MAGSTQRCCDEKASVMRLSTKTADVDRETLFVIGNSEMWVGVFSRVSARPPSRSRLCTVRNLKGARGMWTRTVVMIAMITAAASCGKSSTPASPSTNPSPNMPAPSSGPYGTTALGAAGTISTAQGSANGVAGAMPAYYDGQLFTINFTELPPGGEGANLSQNGSINNIYQSDGCKPGGQTFLSVIDAIQGDGFNPLWREVQVVFTNPSSCRQFTSDNDILAAVAANVVTLQPTNELYRCSVIGKK
jgi:hypothetical protein